MIQSMTGYGKAEVREGGLELSIELRSVNHRFLDVVLRLPRSISELETRIKEVISRRLSRGRVSGAIQWAVGNDELGEVTLNREVADRYHALLLDLKESYDLAGDVDLATLASRQDVWKFERRELDLEGTWSLVEKGISEALDELVEMRGREGKQLAQDLAERVSAIRAMGQEIEAWMPGKVEQSKEKLQARLDKLISTPEILPERLAMEAAVLADRMDCTEECVRLRIHCDHFDRYLTEGGPVGRKLNFLLQEMGREANTIGVKANDAEVSHQIVRLKEEVEKLREQVQNIE